MLADDRPAALADLDAEVVQGEGGVGVGHGDASSGDGVRIGRGARKSRPGRGGLAWHFIQGVRRGSNPHLLLHRQACRNRYTTDTITPDRPDQWTAGDSNPE